MTKLLKNLNILTFWKFINCIVSTAPLSLWFAIFSFKRNWKTFTGSPVVRFFCIFALVDIGVKFYKMIVSGNFERRYMLPLLCVLIIFAADGIINKATPFLNKHLKKRFSFLTQKKVVLGLISLLFIIYFVIILIPSVDHPWFQSIRVIVKQKCPPNEKPVILSNTSDPRLGYYPNAELFVFSTEDFKLTNKAFMYNKTWSSNKLIKNLPQGINNFANNAKALGGQNVFLFIYGISDNDFRKLFPEKSQFPFKLLKVYRDRHKNPVCFYQFK